MNNRFSAASYDTLPVLSQQDEIALAIRIEQGDKCARDTMHAHNMRLVISIAQTYNSHKLELDDRIQEGAIGLLTAIERFDYRKGYRFSTYATHWIRQAISRAISNNNRTIRIPANRIETRDMIYRIRDRFIQLHGRAPTIEELSELSEMTTDTIIELFTTPDDACSLDSLKSCRSPLIEFIKDTASPDPVDVVLNAEQIRQCQELVDQLPIKQRQIVLHTLLTDEPMSLKDYARSQGLTGAWASFHRIKAINAMRHAARKLGMQP